MSRTNEILKHGHLEARACRNVERRSNLFRFKFSNPPHPPLAHIITTCICGFDGSSAYLWTKHHEDEPTIHMHESILMAVAAATGISSGSAHTIAQFLLGDADGGGLMAMEDVVLGADETVEEIRRNIRVDAPIDRSIFRRPEGEPGLP